VIGRAYTECTSSAHELLAFELTRVSVLLKKMASNGGYETIEDYRAGLQEPGFSPNSQMRSTFPKATAPRRVNDQDRALSHLRTSFQNYFHEERRGFVTENSAVSDSYLPPMTLSSVTRVRRKSTRSLRISLGRSRPSP